MYCSASIPTRRTDLAFDLRGRRFPYVAGASALALLLLLSLALRWRDFSREAGAPNADATYHMLLTLTALRENPASSHRWLPTVSLGGALDKSIPWGGAIPAATGDYIYTSFPPLGFVAPYLSLTAVNVAPTVRAIAFFNFVLGVCCAFMLFALLVRVLALNGADSWTSVTGAVVATAVAIFSREVLLSHGLNYWSQSLYQPVLALSLYFLVRYLEDPRRVFGVALVAVAFCGAMIEWSGYLFAAGLALILWFDSRDRRASRRLAVMILLAAAAAGILTIVHFGSVLGFADALHGMFDRAEARSASHGSGRALLRGYLASYGFFLAAVGGALALVVGRRGHSVGARDARRVIVLVFIASVIPLLENVVLLEHAGRYSFDRLKFVFPAAILVALSFSMMSVGWRMALAAVVGVACVQGVLSYRAELEGYSRWDVVAAENKALVERIGREVDVRCALLSTNQDVRGYTTMLFHRGVHEMSSLQQTDSLRSARGACGSVHLESVWAFPELRDFRKATVTRTDGSVVVLAKP